MSKNKFFKFGVVVALVMSVAFLLFSFVGEEGLVSSSDFDIIKYDMEVEFDEMGNMHVKESVTNRYNYLNRVFYKNIKYNKNNSFSSLFDKSNLVNDVKLTVESGNEIVFDSETDVSTRDHFVGYSYNFDFDERGDLISCGDDCDQIFYYDASGIDEVTTFNYEYTISGVVTQYKDISEINWVFLDIQSMPVENIEISITLPDGEYSLEESHTFFHGSSKGQVNFVEDNKVVITASKLLSNEMIEARLLVDNDVFGGVTSKNKHSVNRLEDLLAFEEDQIKQGDIISFINVYGIYGVYVILILSLGYLAVRAYKKLDKEHKSDFYNEYYRELPAQYGPAVMGYLYRFEEVNADDLTATLLDLIRRKYLILDTNNCGVNDDNPNYLIKLNKDKSLEDLLEHEKHLINWFINDIGDGNEVSARVLNSCCDEYSSAVEYNNKYDKWMSLVKKEAKQYNFFEKGLSSGKSKYNGIGATVGIVLGLVMTWMLWFTGSLEIGSKPMILGSAVSLLFAYIIYICSINKRSKSGNEDYVRWAAFKKFLEEFSTFEDYPIPSLIVWEHYLVYATSFGIANKVTKQLKLKMGEDVLESRDTTFILYYGLRYNYAVNMSNNVSKLRYTATSTISRHNSTRGAGGSFSNRGGGFSGGSSFGGGGGSFGGR